MGIEDGSHVVVSGEILLKKTNKKISSSDFENVQGTTSTRSTRKFSRSWKVVSAPIDVDRSIAELQNGVLTITMPKDKKKMEEKVQTVPVLEQEPALPRTNNV